MLVLDAWIKQRQKLSSPKQRNLLKSPEKYCSMPNICVMLQNLCDT